MKNLLSDMESLLTSFHRELLDLKYLIDFYELETELHGNFTINLNSKDGILFSKLSEKIKSFKLSKFQFNYNSIIISLYGSFERFIENCLITYVDKINQLIVRYNDLPESILKNHFMLSLSLLNKIEQPKYSGPLRKEVIIKNLHTCINTSESYQLNKDAFAQHGANFRLQVIEEAFSHIGILQISQKILKTESFKLYINDKLGLNENAELIAVESFQILNDLAEYRNYVAHGISSEIIQNSILKDYLVFFEEYSKALREVLEKDLLYRESEVKGIELGEITDLYQDGKVVCFKSNNVAIRKNDLLIGKNTESIVKTRIKTMKFEDKEIEEVDTNDNYEIGVELMDKFKKTYKICLLKT